MWSDFAPAKVNLCLHVTGQRSDGLHDLESLVVFPNIGDALRLEEANALHLTINGPFGDGLSGDNLILKAARLMGVTANFYLTKNLPIASGIGGGSSDAAAAIRLISRAFDMPIPDTDTLMQLGADIPVCVLNTSAIMSGAGEVLTPVSLPTFGMVLINTGQPVSTAKVFDALHSKINPPMDVIPSFAQTTDLLAYVQNQRNDLEQPVIQSSPVVSEVLSTLRNEPTCAVARMSGSGGTCFGLFENSEAAQSAAEKMQSLHLDWWVASA